MDIKKVLCEQVAVAKIEKGLTYDEICAKTGIHKSQLIKILRNGGKGVSVDKIEKILTDLGYIVELSILVNCTQLLG